MGSQYRSSLIWSLIMAVVTVIWLVLLEVWVNICFLLLHCWFLCSGGDNDAGKDNDRCFIAGNGANRHHLYCIMALRFHVKKKNKQTNHRLVNQLYNSTITRHTQSYYFSLNLFFCIANAKHTCVYVNMYIHKQRVELGKWIEEGPKCILMLISKTLLDLKNRTRILRRVKPWR